MSGKRYAAVGTLFANRLEFPDGRVIGPVMGGAAMYVYSALLLGTPDALLITGTGRDFDRYFGEWFTRNGCARDGLIFKGDKNEYSIIRYAPDGTYACSSVYGPAFRRTVLGQMRLDYAELAPFFDGLAAVYLTAAWSEAEREALLRMKAKSGARIMWELPTEMAKRPLGEVVSCVEVSDIWSLNRPESFALFGTESETEVCKRLLDLGRPCYYRVGQKGAYMVQDGRVAFSPAVHAVPQEQEIDPTGCGNSSTGAAMWAFAEGRSPLESCVWGNTAAAFTVRQHGPYPVLNDETRREAAAVYARALADAEYCEL